MHVCSTYLANVVTALPNRYILAPLSDEKENESEVTDNRKENSNPQAVVADIETVSGRVSQCHIDRPPPPVSFIRTVAFGNRAVVNIPHKVMEAKVVALKAVQDDLRERAGYLQQGDEEAGMFSPSSSSSSSGALDIRRPEATLRQKSPMKTCKLFNNAPPSPNNRQKTAFFYPEEEVGGSDGRRESSLSLPSSPRNAVRPSAADDEGHDFSHGDGHKEDGTDSLEELVSLIKIQYDSLVTDEAVKVFADRWE